METKMVSRRALQRMVVMLAIAPRVLVTGTRDLR
jgi:hypothetical protein